MKEVRKQTSKAQPKTIKTYVTVSALFDPNGQLTPEDIGWRDGRIFHIDKVLGVENYPKDSAVNLDMKFTCLVWGKICYLYFENWSKWFVEEKIAA